MARGQGKRRRCPAWEVGLRECGKGTDLMEASACNVGDSGLIPGSGRSPGEGNGKPLQYSCLENSMDGGAWWATVHGVAESDTTERLHFTSGLAAASLVAESPRAALELLPDGRA